MLVPNLTSGSGNSNAPYKTPTTRDVVRLKTNQTYECRDEKHADAKSDKNAINFTGAPIDKGQSIVTSVGLPHEGFVKGACFFCTTMAPVRQHSGWSLLPRRAVIYHRYLEHERATSKQLPVPAKPQLSKSTPASSSRFTSCMLSRDATTSDHLDLTTQTIPRSGRAAQTP